jgi:SAM-dependent methyltransferase
MMVLRADDGDVVRLDADRWHADSDLPEQALLNDMTAPILDVGCGPGRVVAALGRRGVPALGIDPAPSAVTMARRRGANVLQRSVFDPLPAEGRWATVLLLDGNIGIGGDAVRLLRRCRALISPSGTIVVEVEAPGRGWTTKRVRFEHLPTPGPWFWWAVVGADAIVDVAAAASLRVVRALESDGRRFAFLSHLP